MAKSQKEPSKGKAASSKPTAKGMYSSVIERVFAAKFKPGAKHADFSRDDIEAAAETLDVDPKNVGDLVYTYRYRRALPDSIRSKAPSNHVWIIRGVGAAQYRFAAVSEDYAFIRPRQGLAEIRVPDATPGVIAKYALDDEQALLAKLRYNRLIDIFMGVTCYSLQSHLRTQVEDIGQVETDEIYVGIDKQGAHYVFPVQAKGGTDQHSIVQIEQDFGLCREKFPTAICRAIAAQFVDTEKIALFAFDVAKGNEAVILTEKHYRLVAPEDITEDELKAYRKESLKG